MSPDKSIAPQTITVWVCPQCGYWRQEKSTGVHQHFPDNGPGRLHKLIAQNYRKVV